MSDAIHWTLSDFAILLPALLAGLLVTATHVPLGRRVLARGIIFLDLAIAQVAGLGIIIANRFDWHEGTQTADWHVQLIAAAAAIIGVLILHYSERRWPDIQEALIGSLFVVTSSVGIVLLASDPHAGEQLKELLVGQILWVSYQQLLLVALLYSVVLALWFGFCRHSSSLCFYLLFALSITASVQLVGIYLVFASLILPALAVRQLAAGALVSGYVISALAYALGLYFAAMADLPAGAMIVITLAVVALLAALLLPKFILPRFTKTE